MAKATKKKDPIAELEEAAVGDFLEAIGVKVDDKARGAAQSALRDFVKACFDRSEAGEYEDK